MSALLGHTSVYGVCRWNGEPAEGLVGKEEAGIRQGFVSHLQPGSLAHRPSSALAFSAVLCSTWDGRDEAVGFGELEVDPSTSSSS